MAVYVEVPNSRPPVYELTDNPPVPERGRWRGYQFEPTPAFIVHSKMHLHEKPQEYVVRGVTKSGRLLVQTHALTDTDWDKVGMWHEVECGDTVEGYRFKRYALKPIMTIIKLASDAAKIHARMSKKQAKQDLRDEKVGCCPVCFGDFVVHRTDIAETRSGTIVTSEKRSMVHHGYERPGYGYIVGDCHGVGFEPFEISCEGTRSWLNQLNGVLNYRREALRQLDLRDEIVVDMVVRRVRHGRHYRNEIEKKIIKRDEDGFKQAVEERRRELTSQIGKIERDIEMYTDKIRTWRPAKWPRK